MPLSRLTINAHGLNDGRGPTGVARLAAPKTHQPRLFSGLPSDKHGSSVSIRGKWATIYYTTRWGRPHRRAVGLTETALSLSPIFCARQALAEAKDLNEVKDMRAAPTTARWRSTPPNREFGAERRLGEMLSSSSLAERWTAIEGG
jgi:hypothetical protein